MTKLTTKPSRAARIALVTGASSGIGRATAARLAAHGYRVFGTARDPARAAAVAGVEMLALDVADDDSPTACVEALLLRTQRLDVLVNNAGRALFGAVEETTAAEARALFDTNVLGALRMVRAVLPAMRAQRAGLIVNVSSVLGFLPAPFMGLYAASKHALEGLSESLDHEVRGFGVRVVVIQPHFTNTPFGARQPRTLDRLEAYAGMGARAAAALAREFERAAGPEPVAAEILRAIEGAHRLRRPAGSRARLLSRLRRFLPPGPVDRSIRRVFALS